MNQPTNQYPSGMLWNPQTNQWVPAPPPPEPPKKKGKARKIVLWVVLGFVALLVLLSMLGSGNSTPAPSAPAPTHSAAPYQTGVVPAPSAPATVGTGLGSHAAGTYSVGTNGNDLRPGTYRTANDLQSSCYWARLSDTSGDFSAIIANGNTSGPAIVTVKPGDAAVQFTGSCVWTADSPS